MRFLDLLASGRILLTDGAMGTLLSAAGMPVGQNTALMAVRAPDVVERIHAAYFAAGSDLVFTNTFSAAAPKLANSGYTVEQVVTAAVGCAKRAAAATDGLVALDIGPLGELLEPLGTLSFDRAVALFAQQIRVGAAAGVDLIAIETMMDLYETKAAMLAAKECCDLPIMATMTFEPSGRTFTGCGIPSMALTLEGLGADVIGVNCSVGPTQLAPLLTELSRWTRLPLAAKPNAGLPNAEGEYHVTPAEFAAQVAALIDCGASVVGGCCGTTPDHLAALAQAVLGRHPLPRPTSVPDAICTPTRVVTLDTPRIVGERLNPTGKKLLKQALADGDLGYVQRQAAAQETDGAALLDLNVGVPGLDEPAVMARAVGAVQAVVSLPLQIDSANPDAIEAGLRAVNGRALVNSVNGRDDVLDRLLPVIKKYGAMFVGLTLDENGIPETADERVRIAQKIAARAEAFGIPRENLVIDCLTLTVGAGDPNAAVTLEAVRRVSALGFKTTLGVSNVSFGLPRRELVNRTFLTLALDAGLTLPILNPADVGMREAFEAWMLLSGRDRGGERFVARHSADAATVAALPPATAPQGLADAIFSGLEAPAADEAARELASRDPETLIADLLIPTLDEVGRRYEAGEIFLPQLIRSAAAAKAAFDRVREQIARQKAADPSRSDTVRGTIVLATVQGDVHDIGKNIVRAILENYGYRILDLGRDVAPERVAQSVESSGAALVGLSALMTSTLPAMCDTITLLHTRCPACRVVVGGAVLTAEYAARIGAHFYACDASATVRAAHIVFGDA